MFRLNIDYEYVTAIDVKEYTYCPIIPWIMYNFDVTIPPTISMKYSTINAEEKEAIAMKLKLPKPWLLECKFINRKYKAMGVVDIVAGEKRVIVVEVKKNYRKYYDHFKVQLMYYSWLVNTTYKPVRKAVLVLGDKVIEYEVTGSDLEKIKKIVLKVKRIKAREEPPIVNQILQKCNNCWYRRYCPNIIS